MSSGWGNGDNKVVLSYAKHRGMVDGKSSEQPEHPLCISGKYDCDEDLAGYLYEGGLGGDDTKMKLSPPTLKELQADQNPW